MKKFNKIMCTALAALTIVSSSAAISSSFTGTGFGTAITADAAKSIQDEVLDSYNKIIKDYDKRISKCEAKCNDLAAMASKETNAQKKRELNERIKKGKYIIKELKDERKQTIANRDAMFYKKYTGNTVSIVDALKAIGVNPTTATLNKIAKYNEIANYSGTAAQNTKMLNLLKKGKLLRKQAAITLVATLINIDF